MNQPDATMLESLQRAGLVPEPEEARFERLTGGVSSDIWRVDIGDSTFCIKRALAKLRVAADWQAPVERSRFEVEWNRVVGSILADAAPEVLHHDEDDMWFAMPFLDPDEYLLWKSELRDGRADVVEAAEVGRRLGLIHSATAGDPDVEARFPANDFFYALRLEPYLEATARGHPDLADELMELSRRTGSIRTAMIHGDVSPKNILLGPDGPVFLDAECACIGDPAFDLAFCLNHLLLKCLWNPSATRGFLDSFGALAEAYLNQVDWEPAADLELRAATLLPGLFLARVDGKSPVEYLTEQSEREHVRRCARSLLFDPPQRLAEIARAWEIELSS